MNLDSTWSVIITAAPALLVAVSGITKLSGMKPVAEGLTKMGLIQYMRLFALAEITFASLFVIPSTNNIGFILLMCYFSGALATELSHKGKIIVPAVILLLLSVSQYVVKSETFLG